MKNNIAELQFTAETWSPQRVLAWAFETFGSRVAISSAFGAEGMVLIDIASRLHKDFRLFTVDTEFLFPETYALMDQIEQKYQIKIERVFSLLSPDVQEDIHGAALWARARKAIETRARRLDKVVARGAENCPRTFSPRSTRRWDPARAKNPVCA